MHWHTPLAPKHTKKAIRIIYGLLLLVCVCCAGLALGIIYTKNISFTFATLPTVEDLEATYEPFPVSVYPKEKTIVENTAVTTYLSDRLSYNIPERKPAKRESWMRYIIAEFAQLDWYQNLASPHSRLLVVRDGARKEEVIKNIGDILKWDTEERQIFETLVTKPYPELSEGIFFPAHYLVAKDASPEAIARIISDRFTSEITARYTQAVSAAVPLSDALILASMLEREAYDFTDMREISGVIWNRLFIDMKLQIDATLQYANGTTHTSTWYPRVSPEDKYIDSPFNTYQNKGLPPQPIGNPSTAAVLAALNPTQTECLFYFHDIDSQFHCTQTYQEHVQLLKQYYGQGK